MWGRCVKPSKSCIIISFKIAHLDVRLANICLLTGGHSSAVKLIDLDRSETSTKLVMQLDVGNYGNSVMYKAGSKDRTLGHLDWRQLEIMIYAFLNGITGNLYHSQMPEAKSDFLKHLVEDGLYLDSCFSDWSPDVDITTAFFLNPGFL